MSKGADKFHQKLYGPRTGPIDRNRKDQSYNTMIIFAEQYARHIRETEMPNSWNRGCSLMKKRIQDMLRDHVTDIDNYTELKKKITAMSIPKMKHVR